MKKLFINLIKISLGFTFVLLLWNMTMDHTLEDNRQSEIRNLQDFYTKAQITYDTRIRSLFSMEKANTVNMAQYKKGDDSYIDNLLKEMKIAKERMESSQQRLSTLGIKIDDYKYRGISSQQDEEDRIFQETIEGLIKKSFSN